MKENFILETMSDFPDDPIFTTSVPITEAHIEAMMRNFAKCGIRRVSWGCYADGRGGFLTPGKSPQYLNLANTYHGLGQNPLAVAVAAAHRNGIEIYAYFKPYETGIGAVLPEGSLEACLYGRLSHIGGRLSWMDPFVSDNPHLRIKRRSDDLDPELQAAPIRSIKLRKADGSPTRITAEHIQIWVSDMNYRYRRIETPFTITESVEPCPREVRSFFSGALVACAGTPQLVLTIDGLDLRDPYILVTTDFTEGTPDFSNTDLEMLSVYAADGREIPGEIASATTALNPNASIDFSNCGLEFDTGYNGNLMTLDESNARGNTGFVAFARGRNQYLPGALCETEPEVQEFWLNCIDKMLEIGVDGIDFREESHSTHTNHPEDYGFNDVVLEACRQRGQTDRTTIAAVRGDAYTAFLARAKQRINACGKKMRINLQTDWYRTNPPITRRLAYPANLDFQWRRWLTEGLADEVILRHFAVTFDEVFDDAVTREIVACCRTENIPVIFNWYISRNGGAENLPLHFEKIKDDGRFAGFVLYETANFLNYHPDGNCEISAAFAAALSTLECFESQ